LINEFAYRNYISWNAEVSNSFYGWTPKELPPSTCALRKGVYYVSVTVPKDIEHLFKSKQIRVSTGTSDIKAAQKKQHKITAELYSKILKVLTLHHLDRKSGYLRNWESDAINLAVELGVYREGFQPQNYRKYLDQAAQDVMNDAIGDNAKNVRPVKDDLYLAALHYIEHDTIDDTEWVKLSNPEVEIDPSKTSATNDTIIGRLNDYVENRNWNRLKTKSSAINQINRFARMVGNLNLTKIEKNHAYDYARLMHEDGYAHKTIRSSISAVSAMLEWCERNRMIPLSPFSNLKLSDYGKPPEKYLPFEKAELINIFKTEMSAEVRLLLSILITTGMRLDEAALLTWERVKEADGIRYFSLQDGTDDIIVKNTQSKRLIALPDCLLLPQRGQGRLFTYRLDKDGKAENAASRSLMTTIRKCTQEPRKVVHSFRGTLKDLLRDANVTKEINDFITGHGQGDEASEYGVGPSLETKFKAVNAINHPWLWLNQPN
jgi:integrase